MQQHEVNAAAEALLAQNLRPTVARVREQLGRGSPNRVGPMLEAWFATLAPRLGIPTADAPAGMPAAVRQAFAEVWNTALEEARAGAQAALQAEHEALAHQQEILEAARAAFVGQQEASAARERDLRAALEGARLREVQLDGHIAELRQGLTQRERELADARGSLAELVQQKDGARRDHERQLQQHTHEREKLLARSEATERRLLEEVDRVRQEAKAAQKTHTDLERRAQALRGELDRARQASAATVHTLEVERATLQERLAGAERSAASLQELIAATAKQPGKGRSRIPRAG